jgi:hypothetical protein
MAGPALFLKYSKKLPLAFSLILIYNLLRENSIENFYTSCSRLADYAKRAGALSLSAVH